MFRVATTSMLAAVAIKGDASKDKNDKLICRPSELPVYASKSPESKKIVHPTKESALHQSLEKGIRSVRTQVQSGYQSATEKTGVFGSYITTAKDHTQRTIDYLREPQNTLQRSGAIAGGGLIGFILAVRGGIIKKVFYSAIGAASVASVCYPAQAEEQARVVLYEGRKAFTVAYNFVKGVKPGDEVPADPIGKFPTSLQDLKHIANDLWDEAKDMIFPKKK